MFTKPHMVKLRTGTRLDRYLTHQLAHVSRNRIQRHIEQGDVLVNGRRVRSSYRLQGGEELTLLPVIERDLDLCAEAIPLEVVHEDGHLLVIHKPAGLVVHPVGREFKRTVLGALHQMLRARGEDTTGLGIVHRLDRLTSGLLVVAKTLAARRMLSRQVEERRIHREYVAFAVGNPASDQGSFRWAIRRDPTRPTRMQALTLAQVEQVLAAGLPSHVSSSGYSDSHADVRPRAAVTHYAVLRRWPGICLLRLRLESGRTHQIRVHAQAAGLPLIGDPLYGPSPAQLPAGLALQRPALHARRLEKKAEARQ